MLLIPLPVKDGERVARRKAPSRVRGMRGPKRTIVGKARRLRRKSTDAETKLWFALRDRRLDGHKFIRQDPIGSYIVDFICREKKLVIEVDGGQHSENARDKMRDRNLQREGYRVLRYWNNDVLGNLDGVLSDIRTALSGDC